MLPLAPSLCLESPSAFSMSPDSRSLANAGCSSAFSDTCPVFPGPRKSFFPPGKGTLMGRCVLLMMSMVVFGWPHPSTVQVAGQPPFLIPQWRHPWSNASHEIADKTSLVRSAGPSWVREHHRHGVRSGRGERSSGGALPDQPKADFILLTKSCWCSGAPNTNQSLLMGPSTSIR